jgi:hypothetical protein
LLETKQKEEISKDGTELIISGVQVNLQTNEYNKDGKLKSVSVQAFLEISFITKEN